MTDPGHVDELRTRLAGTPLGGLVNNAGIALAGPLVEMPLDELRRQFEVNVFGQIAVTQVALPSLRTGRGRVVNIGSIGGRVAQPFTGAYCGSKGAIHLMSSSLRRDCGRGASGSRASSRARSRTEGMWGKGDAANREAVESMSPEGRARYARGMEGMGKVVRRQEARASSRRRWRGGSNTRCSRAGRGPSTRSAATPTHWGRSGGPSRAGPGTGS